MANISDLRCCPEELNISKADFLELLSKYDSSYKQILRMRTFEVIEKQSKLRETILDDCLENSDFDCEEDRTSFHERVANYSIKAIKTLTESIILNNAIFDGGKKNEVNNLLTDHMKSRDRADSVEDIV